MRSASARNAGATRAAASTFVINSSNGRVTCSAGVAIAAWLARSDSSVWRSCAIVAVWSAASAFVAWRASREAAGFGARAGHPPARRAHPHAAAEASRRGMTPG